jgi:hypothetical protein
VCGLVPWLAGVCCCEGPGPAVCNADTRPLPASHVTEGQAKLFTAPPPCARGVLRLGDACICTPGSNSCQIQDTCTVSPGCHMVSLYERRSENTCGVCEAPPPSQRPRCSRSSQIFTPVQCAMQRRCSRRPILIMCSSLLSKPLHSITLLQQSAHDP